MVGGDLGGPDFLHGKLGVLMEVFVNGFELGQQRVAAAVQRVDECVHKNSRDALCFAYTFSCRPEDSMGTPSSARTPQGLFRSAPGQDDPDRASNMRLSTPTRQLKSME